MLSHMQSLHSSHHKSLFLSLSLVLPHQLWDLGANLCFLIYKMLPLTLPVWD